MVLLLPLLIAVSNTEMLLDEPERLHEKACRAGVDAWLSAFPGLPGMG